MKCGRSDILLMVCMGLAGCAELKSSELSEKQGHAESSLGDAAADEEAADETSDSLADSDAADSLADSEQVVDSEDEPLAPEVSEADPTAPAEPGEDPGLPSDEPVAVEPEEPVAVEPEEPVAVEPEEPVAVEPDAPSTAEPAVGLAESAPSTCAGGLGPVNVSAPTKVIGNGTPASCGESGLRAAVAEGGVITFNCGPAVTTIALSEPLVAPSDRDTTIDGGNRVVLDGMDRTQILRSVQPNFRVNDHMLSVQRMVLTRGRDDGTGFQPRDGERLCAWGAHEGGGGAIFTRDMNVHVWGVTFVDNNGPALGPDVAGGAIYMLGAKDLVVANSVFRGNRAANGGAIGLLHVAATLTNVRFENNSATGTNGNFAGATGCPVFNHEEQGGAGGLGGAFYSDGFENDNFCGVELLNNDSGDLGGALFRSAYWGLLPQVARQAINWDRCLFEGNHSVRGGGGAAYVNNSLFTLTNSTFAGNDAGEGDGGALKLTGLTLQAQGVDFTGNHAGWAGGVAHWGGGPEGAGSTSGLTFTDNAPNNFAGVFPQ